METLTAHQAAVLTVDEVISKLSSDSTTGLSEGDVLVRRKTVGWNEFNISSSEPLWKKYFDQFKNPLIVLLLISAIISVAMKQFDDAISITLAITIVVTVAFVQEYRSEKSLEALNKLVPPKCHCLRHGILQEVFARELVPGDVVCVSLGDRLPADMRIIEGTDLQVNESSFTGETMPSAKNSQVVKGNPSGAVTDLTNIVYMGTFVVSGRGMGVVICGAEDSEFGTVFKMMETMESPKTPLQRDMDTLGKQLSFYSMCIIGLIMLIGWLKGDGMLNMFTIGVSLAVAAIPEGLPIVVTVTLALGVMRMASRHAIVKKLPVVETLGCVTVVCSDKTGTLTENELTVKELYTTSGLRVTVMKDSLVVNGATVTSNSHPDVSQVIEIGCVCSNAQLKEGGGVFGHPVDTALFILSQKCGLAFTKDFYIKEEEIPFSPEKKWMSVKVKAKTPQYTAFSGSSSVVMMKGALDRLLLHCPQITPSNQRELEEVAMEMGRKGLRVLALGKGPDLHSIELLGLVGMMDPPREGVGEAIQYLHDTGVGVKIITGDAKETAISVAEQLGVWNGHCISGSELEDSVTNVAIVQSSVFYRVAPKHKINIIKALQESHHILAMTGDGTNDAVALKGADIGIAMGQSGTDVCREAADMILTDDNFLTIVSAIKEGKGIFYNIRNFVRFQLSTSIAALSLIAVSTVMGLPNPLNAMQILWINIIMDGPPAQSLGVEPVDEYIESQPPRKTKDSVITKSLILQTCQSALIILVGTLWIFWKEMTFDNKVTPRDTTMTFTCFVLFDMFNAFSCRSQMESSLSLGLFRNQAFVYAVIGSLVGQLLVIYFPLLQAIFDTEALSLWDIITLVCLASTVLIADELRKFVLSGKLSALLSKLQEKRVVKRGHVTATELNL